MNVPEALAHIRLGLVAASSSSKVGPLSLRVLIVDDSETTRRILRTIIHSQYLVRLR